MKNRLVFIPFVTITFILLMVGTFLDLTISQNVVALNNNFTKVIAAFSTIPATLALGIGSGLIVRLIIEKYQKLYQRIILGIIAAGMFFGSLYVFGIFSSSAFGNLSTLLSILTGTIVAVPGLILGLYFYRFLPNHNLLKNIIFLVIAVCFTAITIDIIKNCMPRVRYYVIEQIGDALYRPWYLSNITQDEYNFLINEFGSDACKSFPSGHSNIAMSATLIFAFIPVVTENKKLYKYQWLFFLGGFIFFLLIAFSRIYGGKHYLSDTMFSGMFALFVYIAANEIYIRKLEVC